MEQQSSHHSPDPSRRTNNSEEVRLPSPGSLNDPLQAIKAAYSGAGFGSPKGVRGALAHPQEVAKSYSKDLDALFVEFAHTAKLIARMGQSNSVTPAQVVSVLRNTVFSDSFAFCLALLQGTTRFRAEQNGEVKGLISELEEALGALAKRHGSKVVEQLERKDELELAEQMGAILLELSEFQERGVDFDSVRLDSILENCDALSSILQGRDTQLRKIVGTWLEGREDMRETLKDALVALK